MSLIKKIKVIGLGGIGSYLIEPLSRYVSYSNCSCELTFIDGDVYEDKNRERQNFSRCINKAEDSCDNYKEKFPKIHYRYKNEYINEDNVISTIREKDIVFLCVDNHATRKVVSDRCSELDDVCLISGGNDLTDGNVICYLRENGKDVTKAPTDLYSSIANPQDINPGDKETNSLGCQDEVEENPQLLFTNLAIASTMLNCYRKYENNNVNFHQVYVDIDTLRSRPSPE